MRILKLFLIVVFVIPFASLGCKSVDPSFTNSVGMNFVLIPAGEFMMGSPRKEAGRGSDETRHRVRITRPLYMQTTEVTQAQWQAVMGNNPSRYRGDNLPVAMVAWYDAQEFITKLNEKEMGTGRLYRLPTEAEWEYACRAGTTTAFHFGDNESMLGEYAWYSGNSDGKTHPVGTKKPNAWGLYDMHGNVWELCEDWCDLNYYEYCMKNNIVDDPQGPDTGTQRIIRGGSYGNEAYCCRAARRGANPPESRQRGLSNAGGFRVVCEKVGPGKTPHETVDSFILLTDRKAFKYFTSLYSENLIKGEAEFCREFIFSRCGADILALIGKERDEIEAMSDFEFVTIFTDVFHKKEMRFEEFNAEIIEKPARNITKRKIGSEEAEFHISLEYNELSEQADLNFILILKLIKKDGLWYIDSIIDEDYNN